MKRMIALLCVLALLLSMPVYATETTPVISADNVTAAAGATIELPIRITGNTGLIGARITICYDTDLTLKGIGNGPAFAALTPTLPKDYTSYPLIIPWDGISEPATEDGVIVTLTFIVPDKSGNYPIELSCRAEDMLDENLSPVEVKMQAGSITVGCTNHIEVVDAAVEPTCTEPGKTEGKHCSVCNEILVAQTEIPAKGHTWTAASCTAPKTCSVCSATDGNPLGHDWSDWTVTTEATCTAKGEKTRTCQREGCDASETMDIPANGHTEVTDAAVEPTCTEPGKTEGKHCSVCNEILIAQTEIPAKGHTWTAASCTAPRTCSVCSATDGNPLGHDWSDWTVTTEATCTAKGEKTRSCKRDGCDASETVDIPANGHTEGKAVRENVVSATKDHKGSYDEVVYCTVCKTELSRVTRIIPKLVDDIDAILPILPIIGKPGTASKFPFRDVPASAWYYDAVKSAWEVQLIDGVTSTEFRPDANMTVAQAIKLASALHQMTHYGKVTLRNGAPNWYSTYVSYAIDSGLIESTYGNYTAAQMNSPVTRAEFVHIFHAAVDDLRGMNTVTDNVIPDVKTGDAFAAEIYDFYRAGILTGSDANGTFHPASSIKRSEVAAILIRMYDTSVRKTIKLG